jgi:hypothetical protein
MKIMICDAPKTTKRRRTVQVVRLNITLPECLDDHLGKIIAARGYLGASDYFQASIRRDAGLEPAK